MIKDTTSVLHELRGYASPKARLTRLLKSQKLIQVRKGLYVECGDAPVCALASVLYGPSYLSFEYALSWHGLIPERVTSITSACFGKNRSKRYETPFGEYTYRDIPHAVFPYGIRREMENGLPFLIAEPEKALCDMVSKVSSVVTAKAMDRLILEDWRMEWEDLRQMDQDFIAFVAPLYGKRSVMTLVRWMEKERIS